MSNYFPNARPNQNITATLRSITDDPIVVLVISTTPGSQTNLREYIISNFNSNESNYPGYKNEKQLIDVLDKVNLVQVLTGSVKFPNLTTAEVGVPPNTGLTIYGNSNFNSLSVKSATAILYIK